MIPLRGLAATLLLVFAVGCGQADAQSAPASGTSAAAGSNESLEVVKKRLVERLGPSLGKIDEVSRTPIPGVYELRQDTDIVYSDAEGHYVMHGNLIDARAKKNLTEDRVNKLLAINFDQLPVKDAFTIVRGDGKRKIAVFEDPNCGYCKRFERDLQKIDNVTVYMFLYPILGPDSLVKSRAVWCSRDKGKVWQDWMVRDVALSASTDGCDVGALARNYEYGKKNKISGTPTLILADGTRVPGAIAAADLEKMLAAK